MVELYEIVRNCVTVRMNVYKMVERLISVSTDEDTKTLDN